MVRSYLHSLRAFFSVGIVKGIYYITYKRSVFNQKQGEQEKQEHEFFASAIVRRNKIRKYDQVELSETAKLIKQYRGIAHDAGYNIKSRTSLETISLTNKDFSKVVREEVTKYYNCSNTDKLSKKCNRIIECYKKNGREWLLQENWFCLLAYVIMIATMICRVLQLANKNNDIVTFIVYLAASVIWCCIVKCKKLMGKKSEIFLAAFNHQAPMLSIVMPMLFFFMIVKYDSPVNLLLGSIIILASIIYCVYGTLHWYYRSKK